MEKNFIPKAVLFDFDGVLGDTLGDILRAWQSTLAEVGVFFEPEEYFLLEGTKMTEVAKTLCQKHGVKSADWEKLVQQKEKNYLQNCSFELYPGAVELLRALKNKNIRLALVSAARLNRIQGSVPPGFPELFEVVITGEQTERGKPFPDPYLKASEKLGIEPASCLVVENAPLGIESARAAGMRCVAITSTLREDKLKKADWIISKLEDLVRTPPLAPIFNFNDHNPNSL
ncbi:MAG: HAD family phosphatase [Candidatus Liptonbacteria bacterium]